jgi:hypothetical protein
MANMTNSRTALGRTTEASPSARAATRVAAASSAVLGIGFGVPCAYGIWHLARRGEIATVLGYPTYGKGPFEAVGVPTTVPLMSAFLGVCLGEVACGWLLWKGRPAGRTVALWLLPVEGSFWTGFALPFAPPLGIARTIAVLRATPDAPARRPGPSA